MKIEYKPYKKTRFFLLFFLMFLLNVPCRSSCLCGGGVVSGSYLRVSQLGFGWLVPDEQVDADYNPATINNIEGKRLFLAFSTDNNFDFNAESTQNFFGLNSFFVIPVEKLKTAFRYKPLLTLYSSETGYESIIDEFAFMFFSGIPVRYNLKIGISFGVNTYDKNTNYTTAKNYIQNYPLKAGIIYNLNEFWSIGFSAGGIFGKTSFVSDGKSTRKDDNLILTLSMLPEFIYFKHDQNLVLRFLLSLFYESILSEFSYPYLWINEDESYYNLDTEIGLGLYYEATDRTIITFGAKYKQIFNNKSKTYGINTILTTEYDGFDISFFAGFEKSIVVDWFLLRVGYNFLKIKNLNYNYYKENNAVLINKSSWSNTTINIFPELKGNINMGVGIKLGKNILFNFSFGKDLIYARSLGHDIVPTNSIESGFDAELNFVYE